MLLNEQQRASIHRVLVIKLRHLGDTLLTTPVLATLKEQLPHCEVDALVYADAAPLLQLNPALSQLHTIDRSWRRLGAFVRLRKEFSLLRQLRSRHYNLIVHLTDHPRGAALCYLLRPAYATAPNRPDRGFWWQRAFSHFYSLPHLRHTVDLHLDAVRCLGLRPALAPKILLDPGVEAKNYVRQLLQENGLLPQTFAVFHATSRWSFKSWAPERSIHVIRYFQDKQIPIVVTASPDPQEIAVIKKIEAQVDKKNYFNFAGRLSLLELAALLSYAKMFVGFDSLPLHMASALQVPSVAFFGPSSERIWGPWHNQALVLFHADYACRPCGLNGCGHSRISDCLENLSMTSIENALQEMWQGRAAPAVTLRPVSSQKISFS